MNKFTRRRFLSLGAKTIAGSGLALGAHPWITLGQAAQTNASDADYRALVCVYLEGGSDGFSMLVPTDDADYNEYASSRQILAVDRGGLSGISTLSGNHGSLAMNSMLQPLHQLYSEQRMAMVANVGNIIVPTNKEEYESLSVALPAQLFSHADQEIQWQQLQGRGRSDNGWGALAANLLKGYQERDYLTSITLDGANYWQSGADQRPFALKEDGLLEYSGLDATNDWEQPRLEAFRRIMQKNQQHMFSKAYAEIQNRAMNITAELGAVLESKSSLIGEQPPENSLAAQLAMVAQLIASRQELGMRRQVFYVRMKGFDVHDHQNQNQPTLFAQLADALSYFQQTIDQLGESNNVTTFTASDFGRSLTGNGDGTDHGWGNHLMVMGGAVRGGDVYGSMPRMSVDGPDAVQNGRVIPTTASSQYAATLLNWMGLDTNQLQQVLPTLGNFDQHDLGFLA